MTIEEFNKLNVNDVIIYYKFNKYISDLILNKHYVISNINKEYYFLTIKDDSNIFHNYSYFLFATLKEYEILHRNDKINKILK